MEKSKKIINDGKTCENCKYFDAHTKKPRKGYKIRYGTCNRYPPFVLDINDRYVPAGYAFPQVHSEKWCGEHDT